MSSFLPNFIHFMFQALTMAIVARVLLSWFPMRPDNPIAVILTEITDPILLPLRRIVPSLGMLDITPIVAIFLLQILERLILQVIQNLGVG